MINDEDSGLSFRTVPLSDKLAGGKSAAFRAVMAAGEPHGIDEIADRMRSHGCVVNPVTVAYVVRFLAETIPEMIAFDGRQCVIGELCSFTPIIRGTFPTPNARFDPRRNSLEIAAAVPPALRHVLNDLHPRNISGRT